MYINCSGFQLKGIDFLLLFFVCVDFWVSDMMQLSHKRKVTVQEFKGKPLVSLREFFTKEGKELPTSKGTLLFPIIIMCYVM